MKHIERLFVGDRPVPGMRPSSSTDANSSVVDVEAVPGKEPLDLPAHESAHDQAERRVQDRVVEQLGLSPEAVAEIVEVQRRLGIGFAEAVLRVRPAAGKRKGAPAGKFAIAVIEPIRVRPGRQLLSAHDPAHRHSEQMRLLRTEILLRHAAPEHSMGIAVVGAASGEGRSQLAAELALAFAMLGRSTLLLDADLRRPRQHALFGIELGDGLAQAIVREEQPKIYGVEGYPTLSLVTAGVSPANPLELLSDGRFDALMDDLQHTFEYIIIDTPPCADYADGLVVATVVGHVLTVHRAGHTQYKTARAMLRQLASAQADVLGGVLNRF
jgi:receptor protein-tyrosine kinase